MPLSSTFSRGIMVLVSALLSVSAHAADKAAAPTHRIVVYYLHHTFRCASCNSIESLTKAAVLGGMGENSRHETKLEVPAPFPELSRDGCLSFEPVNVDEDNNKHFLADFATKGKIPVVVEFSGGKIVRHTCLDQVWELLTDNKALVAYVQAAVKDYADRLAATPTTKQE